MRKARPKHGGAKTKLSDPELPELLLLEVRRLTPHSEQPRILEGGLMQLGDTGGPGHA
jgi:hypothetical protein